ncbi:hypothetical protein MBCUT_11750 [Methanobrevibacter cuticularis]|uniref:Uncharacterized protein n=1 Tax=Methanobrevibacter cuticularis TaxID=47311 RepID=A0A166DU46_9EURY|nr:hypothetical protein [Methanobrevibacter cuticularis]KZX15952.1 hypothetical protein MBCUT_11750 [Methanobrevibacter cuticularis]
MKIIEDEKIVIDDKNIYEPHETGLITILDSKIDLDILKSGNNKDFSIKGRILQENKCKLIKNYKIAEITALDTDPTDKNLDLQIGPFGEENIGSEEYVLPSERKCLLITCDEIEDI